MRRTPTLLKRLPDIDTWWSVADRLGISSVAKFVAYLLGSFALVVAVWLWANVPWWGLILIGLAAFAMFAVIVERLLGAIAHARAIAGPEGVDRLDLASQCENLAASITSLQTEHAGAMQAAWWADVADRRTGQGVPHREQHTEAVGKLIEKYGERYAQKAWNAIYAASRIIEINESDIWRMRHGVRGDHDLNEMAMFLTRVAADLRYGQRERVDGQNPMNAQI